MPLLEIKKQITEYLEQLPEDKLHRLANYAAQLIQEKEHNTLQHRQNGFQSLRGKYTNTLSSSEIYALNKQDEINQE